MSQTDNWETLLAPEDDFKEIAEELHKHSSAKGPARVIISAPGKGDEKFDRDLAERLVRSSEMNRLRGTWGPTEVEKHEVIVLDVKNEPLHWHYSVKGYIVAHIIDQNSLQEFHHQLLGAGRSAVEQDPRWEGSVNQRHQAQWYTDLYQMLKMKVGELGQFIFVEDVFFDSIKELRGRKPDNVLKRRGLLLGGLVVFAKHQGLAIVYVLSTEEVNQPFPDGFHKSASRVSGGPFWMQYRQYGGSYKGKKSPSQIKEDCKLHCLRYSDPQVFASAAPSQKDKRLAESEPLNPPKRRVPETATASSSASAGQVTEGASQAPSQAHVITILDEETPVITISDEEE